MITTINEFKKKDNYDKEFREFLKGVLNTLKSAKINCTVKDSATATIYIELGDEYSEKYADKIDKILDDADNVDTENFSTYGGCRVVDFAPKDGYYLNTIKLKFK